MQLAAAAGVGSTFGFTDQRQLVRPGGRPSGEPPCRRPAPNSKNFENNWWRDQLATVSTPIDRGTAGAGAADPLLGGTARRAGAAEHPGRRSANIDHQPSRPFRRRPRWSGRRHRVDRHHGHAVAARGGRGDLPERRHHDPEDGPEAANLPPATYTILGQQIAITAPTPSSGFLTLTFHVDASVLPGGLGGGGGRRVPRRREDPRLHAGSKPRPCPASIAHAARRRGHRRDDHGPLRPRLGLAPGGDDITGPTVTFNRPYVGARYSKFADPKPDLTAAYSCSDPSGVATCVGTVANGDAFDRGTLGTRTFTVTGDRQPWATRASRRSTYKVFTFEGLIATTARSASGASATPPARRPWRRGRAGRRVQERPAVRPRGRDRRQRPRAHVHRPDGYAYVNDLAAPQSYTRRVLQARLGGPERPGPAARRRGRDLVLGGGSEDPLPSGGLGSGRGREPGRQRRGVAPRLRHVRRHHRHGRLYLDGSQVGTPVTTVNRPSGTATLYVGYGDKAPWLRGWMDEVTYFPAVLSATHIREIWLADPPTSGRPRARAGAPSGMPRGPRAARRRVASPLGPLIPGVRRPSAERPLERGRDRGRMSNIGTAPNQRACRLDSHRIPSGPMPGAQANPGDHDDAPLARTPHFPAPDRTHSAPRARRALRAGRLRIPAAPTISATSVAIRRQRHGYPGLP